MLKLEDFISHEALVRALITQKQTVQIVTANPLIVEALLSLNKRNRKIRPTATSRLREEIDLFRWHLTASGIGVDTDGNLSDGQHRLIAFREAGYPPVQFVLVTGLDPTSQAVVDRHAKRSLADALTLASNRTITTTQIAASNALLSITGSTYRAKTFSWAGNQPSDAACEAQFEIWEEDISKVISHAGSSPRAAVIAALAVYHRHDSERSLVLAEQIKTGANLSEHDPAFRLRKALAALKQGGSSSSVHSFRLAASACIAHAEGRKVNILRAAESWASSPWRRWNA